MAEPPHRRMLPAWIESRSPLVSGRKRKGVPGSSSQPGRRSTSSKPESSGTINDPLHAAAFAVWGPLLDEQPRLAHAAYHWNREEDR